MAGFAHIAGDVPQALVIVGPTGGGARLRSRAIAALTRQRRIIELPYVDEQDLADDAPFRQYVALSGDQLAGWVRSVNSVIGRDKHTRIDFYSLGTKIISGDELHPNGKGYQSIVSPMTRSLLVWPVAMPPTKPPS